jgi:penicillin-binding protein 1A
MSNNKSGGGGRRSRNTFVTKSGQTIKIHRNLAERFAASRDAMARRKAARLAGLPKNRFKRILYMFEPRRMYRYWFSREGAIMALKIAGIGIILGFLLLVGVFAYFRKDLPNLKDISADKLGSSIRYYDRTGQVLLWEDTEAVKRIPVKDEEISPFVKQATIAVEDQDFFKHGGFDVRGILRAGVNDVFGSGNKQGGSTITQQLVKLNNDWTKDRTYTRKIKELILAVELERSYSKKEILTGYLNAAPYGNVQYGVESASRDYFQKSAKDLTLAEAAFLASIPKSPSYFSPYGPYFDTEALKARQHYIIDLMLEQRMITKEQHDEAQKVDVLATIHTPKGLYDGIKYPYFVLTAKQQLESRFGADTIQRAGWKVTTTLDVNLQKMAEEQVQKGLAQVKRQGGDEIAFASEDVKTGQMVALVGGVDFTDPVSGQNNYARVKLPPGSTFKPYDYTSLLDNTTNFGAGAVLFDSKGPIPGYPCTKPPARTGGDCAIDYDLRFPGPLTLRYALGGSRNIPAMKAMLIAGVDKTVGTAKKMMQSPGSTEGEARGNYKCYDDEKLSIEAPCYTSSAIGDGAYLYLDENVHGYATLARNGLNIPQTYIMKIEDRAGKTIDEWKPSKGNQAVRPEAAYIVADILSDPKASYLGSKPHNYKGWHFGFKTGTTNDSKDGWMMGFSAQYASGVWVGYHNRQKEMSGFMENMTQPIVQGWMRAAHDNLKPEERPRPAGLQTLPAFVVTTHVGVGSVEPSPSTDLYPSWYKKPTQTNTKQTIDIVSNKLATDCTPTRAKKENTGAGANAFSGDRFVTGGATDASQQDDIHKCEDVRPTIEIASATSSSATVTVTRGTHPLSSDRFPGTLNIVIDGQIVQSFSINDSESGSPKTLNYTYSGSGTKDVKVEVIDSVLYDSSDTYNNVNFSGGVGALNLSPASRSGSSVSFSWSGGTGPYKVFIKLAAAGSYGSASACDSPGFSCSASRTLGSYKAIVRGFNGTGPPSNEIAFN